MQLLLAFLFGTFVVGGLAGRSPSLHRLRKPPLLLGACVLVGVMFYSSRVL
jgi:biotin transporter BioY